MDELIEKRDNKNKFRRYIKKFLLKFYFVFCPMLFAPSLTILLDEYAVKIYEKTLKRIIFRKPIQIN